MIAFTVLGLLVFWIWCFQIGYYTTPAFYTIRALVVVWLVGREADSLLAMFDAYMEEQPA